MTSEDVGVLVVLVWGVATMAVFLYGLWCADHQGNDHED